MKPLIVIPSRMDSARLPGKPLADIHGLPMIAHVLQRALAANAGPVIVACADEEIKWTIDAIGGTAVMTNPDLPSGTDRVRAAADIFDPNREYDVVVNVQGDMPALQPELITAVTTVLSERPNCDIATAVVATASSREISDPNVVKAVLTEKGQALYFSRAAVPSGDGPFHHHVGIYAFRRDTLDQFCALPPSPLEKRERLEQLRALEAGMRIDAAIVAVAPDGVDTPEDLERARTIIGGQS